MRTLWLLLLFVLGACLGTGVEFGADQPQPEMPVLPVWPDDSGVRPRLTRDLLVVEGIEPIILESSPMQIELLVSGYWPQSCGGEMVVEQERTGSVVTVTIYRAVSPDAVCLQVITPYTEAIRLEGGFESGSYQIVVNGVALALVL